MVIISTRFACSRRRIFNYLRGGDFRECLKYAERARDIAATASDPAVTVLAQTLMGLTLNFMGDLRGARMQLDAVLEAGRASPVSRKAHFGFRPLQLGRQRPD